MKRHALHVEGYEPVYPFCEWFEIAAQQLQGITLAQLAFAYNVLNSSNHVPTVSEPQLHGTLFQLTAIGNVRLCLVHDTPRVNANSRDFVCVIVQLLNFVCGPCITFQDIIRFREAHMKGVSITLKANMSFVNDLCRRGYCHCLNPKKHRNKWQFVFDYKLVTDIFFGRVAAPSVMVQQKRELTAVIGDILLMRKRHQL